MSDNDKYQGFDSMPEDTDAVDTETADTPVFDTAAMREPSEASRVDVDEARAEPPVEVSDDRVKVAHGQPYTPPYFQPYYGQPYYHRPSGQQPVYRPYGTQGQAPYYQHAQYGPTPPSPAPRTKGRKKGLTLFFSVLGIILVFCIVLAGVSIGLRDTLPIGGDDTNNSGLTTNDNASLEIRQTPEHTSGTSPAGALTPVEVAEKVSPSVVGVIVYANETGKIASEGSGVVMGPDTTGDYTYIVTCAHVISASDTYISIQISDGTQYEAEMVGYDLRTDVGVVKAKAKGLKAAEFGNSDALRVGEQVFAVGNPGGTEFFGSFTGGMVSAINRPVSSEIGYSMESIQHDAAINPGNSGGALVNLYGQVVGINSQKIVAASYEGMGFAIPIVSAKVIVDSLIKHGYIPNRPKLGVTYLPVSANQVYSIIVQSKGYPGGSIYIESISADSDLVNTKARTGDIIIAANGKKLDSSGVLLELIEKGKVGDTITLRLCRVGSNYQTTEFDVKVKLVEDKGGTVEKATQPEDTTTTDPFEFFRNPWGN